jgi:hypothetical protein
MQQKSAWDDLRGTSPATRHSYVHIAHTRYTHTCVITVSPHMWIQIYCTVLYCLPYCLVVSYMPPPHYVKSVSQPDTTALLGMNNCLQIIETGVRWVVLCLSQDGACTDSFENFHDNSLKGGLFNDITLNLPLFSLVNTFKVPSHQFSSAWKWFGWIGLGMYMDRRR